VQLTEILLNALITVDINFLSYSNWAPATDINFFVLYIDGFLLAG
jgi:hypothetical protein